MEKGKNTLILELNANLTVLNYTSAVGLTTCLTTVSPIRPVPIPSPPVRGTFLGGGRLELGAAIAYD